MHIIFGTPTEDIAHNFTVLELDTIKFKSNGEKVTAYSVIENIPLPDFPVLEAYKTVHQDLMKAYRARNWEYCESAINGLVGKWNGELDSFYLELHTRITDLKDQELAADWDGTVEK